MLPTLHVGQELDPCYLLCSLTNLSGEKIIVEKHTIIALEPYLQCKEHLMQ